MELLPYQRAFLEAEGLMDRFEAAPAPVDERFAGTRAGIVSAKEYGPAFWVARAYHVAGTKKQKLCTVVVRPTREEADQQIAQWHADNASIENGICPRTGNPITPGHVGITCSVRFGIELHEVSGATLVATPSEA